MPRRRTAPPDPHRTAPCQYRGQVASAHSAVSPSRMWPSTCTFAHQRSSEVGRMYTRAGKLPRTSPFGRGSIARAGRRRGRAKEKLGETRPLQMGEAAEVDIPSDSVPGDLRRPVFRPIPLRDGPATGSPRRPRGAGRGFEKTCTPRGQKRTKSGVFG